MISKTTIYSRFFSFRLYSTAENFSSSVTQRLFLFELRTFTFVCTLTILPNLSTFAKLGVFACRRIFQLIEPTSCLLNAFLCTLWSTRKNELRQCKIATIERRKTNNMLLQSHVRFLVLAASLKLKKSLEQKMSSGSVYHFLLKKKSAKHTKNPTAHLSEKMKLHCKYRDKGTRN